MATNRQPPSPTRTATPADKKPHAGYAESSTEREALGRGDRKPRDRGDVRIDGQDPGYGSRARDSDDASSNDDAGSSEFGGRRTADDQTGATDDDDGTQAADHMSDKAGGSAPADASKNYSHPPAEGAGKRR